MQDVVIAGAARTPIGKMKGALARLPAHVLGQRAITAALERSCISAADVSEVIMGQVLTAGAGQNPARQAAVAAGVPVTATAYGINQMCGSGMRAVALAFEAIRAGRDQVMVAGGQESMSLAPHYAHMRMTRREQPPELVDTVLRDGLLDAFDDNHMGWHSEQLAQARGISRASQEAFALRSQTHALEATRAGRFAAEIVPIPVDAAGRRIAGQDESPRSGASAESLAKLRPVFQEGGTVTAGTASPLNDGAAALVLTSERVARARGANPLGRVVSWATAGVEPALYGLGPVPAVQEALKIAGWRTSDVDLFELNEAYAAQSLAVIEDLDIDPDRVNVNGGAIALGHPLGASGARVLVTLLYEMQRRRSRRGVAALCMGGGMGIAMCVARGA